MSCSVVIMSFFATSHCQMPCTMMKNDKITSVFCVQHDAGGGGEERGGEERRGHEGFRGLKIWGSEVWGSRVLDIWELWECWHLAG